MKETARFKSAEPFYTKEADGRKPNTIRYLEKTDPRHTLLMNWICTQEFGAIEIVGVKDYNHVEGFTREITDVSLITKLMPPISGRDCFIISWKHPEPLFDIMPLFKAIKT